MKFFSAFGRNQNKKYKKIHIYNIKEPEEYYHKTILISVEEEHERLRNSKRIVKFITGMSNKDYKENNIVQESRDYLLRYEYSLGTSKLVIWDLIENIIELSGVPVNRNIIFYMYTKLLNINGNIPTANDIIEALLFVKNTYYSGNDKPYENTYNSAINKKKNKKEENDTR